MKKKHIIAIILVVFLVAVAGETTAAVAPAPVERELWHLATAVTAEGPLCAGDLYFLRYRVEEPVPLFYGIVEQMIGVHVVPNTSTAGKTLSPQEMSEKEGWAGKWAFINLGAQGPEISLLIQVKHAAPLVWFVGGWYNSSNLEGAWQNIPAAQYQVRQC